MNSFEMNKIAMSVLVALVALKGVDLVGEGLVHPQKLEKNVYVIEGVEAADAPAGAPAEEALKPIEPLLAQANIENGQKVAKQCQQCHSFDKGGANKTGPHLFAVVGRPIASISGFAYSESVKKESDGGKKAWDVETLNKFIHKPRSVASSTKMAFAGIKKDEDRRDLIGWLKTLKE